MNIKRLLIINLVFCSVIALASVSDSTITSSTDMHSAPLTELSDREYPNNPDKKFRSKNYTKVDYNKIDIERHTSGKFNISIRPTNDRYPTVFLHDIDLMEYIPTIPDRVKDDAYLSKVALINQEWNRNQITFKGNQFKIQSEKKPHKNRISRIDMARSCLNSYLWEIYFYTYNPLFGHHELMYHGWFNFPKDLYRQLFYERNGVHFEKYAEYMEDWKELAAQEIDFDQLRNVGNENVVQFEDLSEEMYPLEGERLKKEDEVIYPRNPKRMSDFHTDRAVFSSFVKPGMYVKKERRKTELSRFQTLIKTIIRRTSTDTQKAPRLEIELSFANHKAQFTTMTIGGIDLDDTTIALEERANYGDLYSMGIGNHTFYENYVEQQSYSSKDNPYFGLLTDENGNYLDSHAVGIDGPIIHRDAQDQDIIHIWLLSYERHALVGHYKIHLR
ncbi:MAG: hypothetical protein KJP00_11075 [Bacteroidia bacterium]|nr:hypothetical protein [Bacteroidia bacterium]